jgi:hypothetical protein
MQGFISILFASALLCSSGAAGSTTSGAGGTSGGAANPGDALPAVCPLFTQDLMQKLSTKPLKPGTDKILGLRRYCNYEHAQGSPGLLFVALSKSQGSPDAYKKGCLHPAFGSPGKVVDVGSWACFLPAAKAGDEQVFNAGNAKWEISMSGDAPLDSLKEAAGAFLDKLPK